jgi:AmmeMemoRadiSam system protein B
MSPETRKVRPAAVAGAFYPAEAGDLRRELDRCFVDDRGPGEPPPRKRGPERRLRAAIVPHAGYTYSGPIAAHVFFALASDRPPATVLILGVNHRGRGAPAALSAREWETPLGPVPTDPDLLHALDRPPLCVDETAHAPEHSIEVELPFVQYTHPHPRFVALSVSFGRFEFLEEVAEVVRGAIRGRDVLLLASTDLSHYLPAAEAARQDRMCLDPILARNAEGLYDTVVRQEISMCGIAPTTTLLAALEGESLSARLLKYGHSGEAEPMRDVVGYASVALESADPLEG